MSTATQTQTIDAQELANASQWMQSRNEPTLDRNTVPNDDTPPENVATFAQLDRDTWFKLVSACFSFFVAGVNDGSMGALIPYIIRDYEVSTAIVSSVYAAQFGGWLIAAFTNTHLCQYLNLGSMLSLGAAVQILSHVLKAWRPPFALFVISFLFAALGQAYNDTHANTFVAGTKGAHRWLGLIHASYSAGCLVGPFVATGVASSTPRWYLFYIFLIGISLMNQGFVGWAFWDTLTVNRKRSSSTEATAVEQGQSDEDPTSRNKDASDLIKSTLRRPSVLLLSLFYFFYIGSAITMSGWVVEYLVDVRDGDLSKMGFVPAGFNGGTMLGRLLLAEPTHRFGARYMVFSYCLVAVALQIVFWLVPNIIAASIAVSFIGFFLGPLFASGVSIGTKLFPPELHSTALAFVFVFAQMGGSLFPIITGAIASSAGVHVLQPILTGLLTATAISWLLVPRPKTEQNAALHQE